MILLDEQVRSDQRVLLTRFGIAFRQIGKDIAPSGIKDENIIPFLLTLKSPTLFTHDRGFFERRLTHLGYCLALLSESDIEAAVYIRKFLRHPRFNTNAKRMGIVARAHREAVHFWQRGHHRLERVEWPG